MPEDKIVWTARGACDACAKPTARRVEGAGLWDVKCHACGAVSNFLSERVRLTPGGPSVEEAVALPTVRGSDPKTTPLGLPKKRGASRGQALTKGLPRIERRKRNLWAAPTTALALVLLIAAGWLMFGPNHAAGLAESTGGTGLESTMALYVEPAATADGPGILDITLLSGDTALHSERIDMAAETEPHSLVFQTVVPAESLRLMVVDEAGTLHIDAPVDAAPCAGALLQVGLRITDSGTVELADIRCE